MFDDRQHLRVDHLGVAGPATGRVRQVETTMFVELVQAEDAVGGEVVGRGQVLAVKTADFLQGRRVHVFEDRDGTQPELDEGVFFCDDWPSSGWPTMQT